MPKSLTFADFEILYKGVPINWAWRLSATYMPDAAPSPMPNLLYQRNLKPYAFDFVNALHDLLRRAFP